MIARIRVAVQEGRSFCVRARHQNEVGTQNVCSQPSRDQAVNVFLRRHQHFAAHVPTLFCARLLILQMHTRGTRINHEFGELHDG